MGAGLRGREVLIAQLDALLGSAASGVAQLLVVEGGPGSGKTAVCRHTADRAAQAGFRVIRAAGVEGESDLPLAGLSLLLRPLTSELADLVRALPGAQQRAITTAAALSDEPVADRFTLGAALLGLATATAEQDPVLIVIDDAHWLDRPSADAISFAARRLGADAVMMLVATRPDLCPLQLGSEVAHTQIGGLCEAEVAALLADAGMSTAPPVVRTVAAATGGLPLAVLETTRALTEGQRAGREALPEPLPIGPDITSAYRARLEHLPEQVRRAVMLAATAGSAPTEIVGVALTRLGLDLADLRAAEDAHVLTISISDIVFVHPLLRAAALHLPTPTQRRMLHQALAEVFTKDPEQRARHLAAATTGPDEHVAAALELAAAEVTRRAGLPASASILAQAALFTPDGDRRPARQLAAAHALAVAGHPEQAAALAHEVFTAAINPGQRLDATVVLLTTTLWSAESDALVDRALEAAFSIASTDPARAVRSMLHAVIVCVTLGQLRRAEELARRAVELSERNAPAQSATTVRLAAAAGFTLVGKYAEVHRLLDGWAPPSPGCLSSTELSDITYTSTVQTLLRLGRFGDAERLFRALVAASDQHSVPSTKAHLLAAGAEMLWWLGRWPQGAAIGQQAVVLAEQTRQPALAGFISTGSARIWASQGNEAQCRAAVSDSLAISRAVDSPPMRLYALAASGLLELTVGSAERAVQPLREADGLRRAVGCRDPAAVPLGADLIEALTRAGRLEEARETLAEHTQLAENSGNPWALATMSRCHALLSADPDEAADHFAAAVELHPPEVPFDAARTELCWGQHLRRRRDITTSRTHLERASMTFERLGAKPWAELAAAELRAAGGRVRTTRSPDLTNLSPQEMHCALAAADGRSNRDIAASMFISPKTVEYHLRKVYTKLGITSRAQLGRILATPTS